MFANALFEPNAIVDAPGYAVGLIQRGSLIYARGFDRANLDHAVAIRASSVFNGGSLAEQFGPCVAASHRRTLQKRSRMEALHGIRQVA